MIATRPEPGEPPRAPRPLGSSPRRAEPSWAPSRPPARPPTVARSRRRRAAGRRVQGSGIAIWRPAVLGGEADGADQERPSRAPSASGRPCRRRGTSDEGDELDAERPRRGRAGGAGVVSPKTRADDEADAAADDEEEGGRDRVRRRGRSRSGRQTSAMPAAIASRTGWKHEPELRHAEVELGLEGREADQEAAHQPGAHARGRPAAARSRRRSPGVPRVPSASSTACPIRVIVAPPISIRWVGPQRVTSWPKSAVPDVVEREAEQGEAPRRRRSGCRRRARTSRPRSGPPPGPARSSGRNDGQGAGGEDAEQAGEDQVVGGVGERPGVAPDVDVEGDVPVHAEQRDEQRGRGRRRREGRPAGQAGDALGEGGGAA